MLVQFSRPLSCIIPPYFRCSKAITTGFVKKCPIKSPSQGSYSTNPTPSPTSANAAPTLTPTAPLSFVPVTVALFAAFLVLEGADPFEDVPSCSCPPPKPVV